jgi:hypothetical protein
MRLITRTAGVLLSAAVILTGTATSASADSETIKDRPSDVLTWPSKAPGETATRLGYRDSIASGVDLRSLRVRHTRKTVVVTAKFSNLGPSTRLYVQFRYTGRSKKEITRFLFAQDGKGLAVTRNFTVKCTVPLTTRQGRKGMVKAVFKRSCFDNPRRIKASAFVTNSNYDTVDAKQTGDFGSPSKVGEWSWTRWLKAG